MAPELRPITPEEFEEFTSVMSHAFGWVFREHETELWKEGLEFDRTLSGFEDGRMVSTAGAITFQMTVPGGLVPTAGVTMISVLPSHRRRGVLRAMMERQLTDVRERSEPVAALWASESLIYGRFGYGMAAAKASWEIDRTHTVIAHSALPAGQVRLIEVDEAKKIVPGVYEAIRPGRAGMLTWPEERWEWMWFDPEYWREGASERRYAIYEEAGEALGAAVYSTHSKWEDGFGAGKVAVRLMLAETLEAYEALWGYLFGIDLVTKIGAQVRPADELLEWMLADPRRLQIKRSDGLWVRILDVPAALEARRYGQEARLVIEVGDQLLPDVGGRFELEGGPEGSTCQQTEEEADLELDVQALGAIYLGADHTRGLYQAGRISGSQAAVRVLDGMFRGDHEPWCPMFF
ncbi:MAG: GNAT family N-acetyltransferase [Acidimicrobiia bacterium]